MGKKYDTNFLWEENNPVSPYRKVTRCFLRALGLVYLFAFLSLYLQITALVGENGILPLNAHFFQISSVYGIEKILLFPSVFWLNSSDLWLEIVCLLGVIGGGCLLGHVGVRYLLPTLYFLYLSLFYAGQQFLNTPGDQLLLEVGFLAIFLPYSSSVFVWFFRCLLFRIVFLNGFASLISHGLDWSVVFVSSAYFEMQPLPTMFAWYLAQLPEWGFKILNGFVLFVGLVVPFFIFLPRKFRIFAAINIIVWQLISLLIGGYALFHLLVIILCLLLLDDGVFLPSFRRGVPVRPINQSMLLHAIWPVFYLTLSIAIVHPGYLDGRANALLEHLSFYASRLRVINAYETPIFTSKDRKEILIEGSNDGEHWQSYEFWYKPGPVTKALPWFAIYPSRLDLQLWVTANQAANDSTWVRQLLTRLLSGEKAVIECFELSPFGFTPPVYIRAMRYDYHFAVDARYDATGHFWEASHMMVYHPVFSLM